MTGITRNVYQVLVLCKIFSSMQQITLYLFRRNRFTFHAYYSKPIKSQVQNRQQITKSQNCKHVLSLEYGVRGVSQIKFTVSDSFPRGSFLVFYDFDMFFKFVEYAL